MNRINFGQRSTLRGAVTIMINNSKISMHRFIATTLFRVVKEWHMTTTNLSPSSGESLSSANLITVLATNAIYAYLRNM